MFDAVDVDRMNRRLDALWEIGKTSDGGVTRLAYSERENEAHEYVIEELSDDFTVDVDSTGNVFATKEPDAERSMFTGSHLDTVYNAGRLDGTLGVITSIEAIEALYASDVEPERPPTLVIFRGEESSRFGHHTIGSRAALGLLEVETFSSTDQNGVPLWQAMQDAGFQPRNLSEPSIDLDRVAGFVETHIEQGKVLEEEGVDIGIVSSIRAPVRYRITVLGEYDHSGATPMGMRRDALSGASEMVCAVETIAESAAEEGDVVATVGDLSAVNGAINKVCGEVEFVLDVRSNDLEYRDGVESTILDELDRIGERRGLEVDFDPLDRSEPVGLSSEMVGLLETGAERSGATALTLPSGGGHDAMNFQLVGIPTGMIFVPSLGGVSHNPAEETNDEAMAMAARTTAYALSNGDVER